MTLWPLLCLRGQGLGPGEEEVQMGEEEEVSTGPSQPVDWVTPSASFLGASCFPPVYSGHKGLFPTPSCPTAFAQLCPL